LEIDVSSTTIVQGEDIEGEIVFRNLTRRRIRVAHMGGGFIWPTLTEIEIVYDGEWDNSYRWAFPGIRGFTAIRPRGEIRRTYTIGKRLVPGEFELTANAGFDKWIGFRSVHMVSEPVIVTVQEK